MQEWEEFSFEEGVIQSGYINPEEPYINEVRAFVNAATLAHNGEKSNYPNTLEDDHKILKNLYTLEDISEGRNDLSR
jgi:hypothetical protein